MTVQIDTTAEIDAVRLKTEGSHPSAPSAGHILLYFVTGTAVPGLYTELADGQRIGPFITGSSGGIGSYVFISEGNPSSVSSFALVSGIDDTYPQYNVDFDLSPATDQVSLRIEYSVDNGANWLSTGYYYAWQGNYSNNFVFNEQGENASIISFGEIGSGSGRHVSGRLHFKNPRTTNMQLIRMDVDEITYQGHFVERGGTASHNTTSKLNGVRFSFSSGNISSGTVRLYGIKNS